MTERITNPKVIPMTVLTDSLIMHMCAAYDSHDDVQIWICSNNDFDINYAKQNMQAALGVLMNGDEKGNHG